MACPRPNPLRELEYPLELGQFRSGVKDATSYLAHRDPSAIVIVAAQFQGRRGAEATHGKPDNLTMLFL